MLSNLSLGSDSESLSVTNYGVLVFASLSVGGLCVRGSFVVAESFLSGAFGETCLLGIFQSDTVSLGWLWTFC